MSSDFPKEVLKKINQFRKNPNSLTKEYLNMKNGISRLNKSDPFIKQISNFMEIIGKKQNLPEVDLSENLCKIAETELEKFIDDMDYIMFRTGNDLKGIITEGNLKNYGLVAEEWTSDIEDITPKLLLNKSDKKNIGQMFLMDPETILIGVAQKIVEDSCFVVTIFSKEEEEKEEEEKEEEKAPVLRSGAPKKKPNEEEKKTTAEEIPKDIDLTELKLAFDLYDPDHTMSIKIADIMHAMDAMDFKDNNPILYQIVADLQNDGTEQVTWERFAGHISRAVTDRETDQGLEDMYGLIIDDPNVKTIKVKELKKIGNEVGVRLNDEEAATILKNTTDSGEDLSQKDFNRYMRK